MTPAVIQKMNRLHAVIRPAAAPPSPYVERLTHYDAGLTIGMPVPAPPVPPEGAELIGYMVHTLPNMTRAAGYDTTDLAAAVRSLLDHGVSTHEILAFAAPVGDRDAIGDVCAYDPVGREWSAWRRN